VVGVKVVDGARRRPEELRRRLLAVGGRLFAEQGFEATTYRQITAEAGVSDSVLFRHFGSKDQLLIEAVLEPFSDLLTQFSRVWAVLRDASAAEAQVLRERFVVDLFVQLGANREALRAMLTVLQSRSGDELMSEVGTRLDTLVEQIYLIAGEQDRQRGRSSDNLELTIRLVVGMFVTTIVLDDWLGTPDNTDARAAFAAMARMALVGGQPTVTALAEIPIPAAVAHTGAGRPANGRRRRPEEVRRALIEAASTLFAENGYGPTTAKQIAQAAGASESMLLRHFGPKSTLAREAVFDPLVEAFDAAVAEWTSRQRGDQSYLVVELYRLLGPQRKRVRLLLGLVQDPTQHQLNHDVRTWLASLLDELVRHQPTDDNTPTHVRAAIAMAIAASALDDWFLPRGPAKLPTQQVVATLHSIAATGRGDPT
jgi:AcrR family transcriptional regulator